jgi:NTP pyrophosphatase (non-canonical NTP hydrolase)
MTLEEAADHCERAFAAYAAREGVKRDEPFYLLKLQEEMGELARHFLELGSDPSAERRREFQGDCAAIVGNALILAKHHGVDLATRLKDKFPAPK